MTRRPTIREGVERGLAVLAVGYFAEDDTDVICVHAADDREGAERCLAAELESMSTERTGR